VPNPAGKGTIKKKYANEDPDFYLKMRGAASTLLERGAVIILELTGMHVTSLADLEADALVREGDRHYLYFRLPKRQRKRRSLRASVPREDVKTVREWLKRYSGRRSTRWLSQVVHDVGVRSGYPNVSPMTYRATRIVKLMDSLKSVRQVSYRTGATFSTIEDHYAQVDPEEEP